MEPFPILGAALSAWVIQTRRPWALSMGLLLLTTKPQEAFLLVPVMLWAIRHWRRDEWVQVVIGPVMVFVLTAALFDWGWLFKVLRAPGGYHNRWIWINILTPLLRLGGDQAINWLDFLFPITLMLALLLFFREQRLAEG